MLTPHAHAPPCTQQPIEVAPVLLKPARAIEEKHAGAFRTREFNAGVMLGNMAAREVDIRVDHLAELPHASARVMRRAEHGGMNLRSARACAPYRQSIRQMSFSSRTSDERTMRYPTFSIDPVKPM